MTREARDYVKGSMVLAREQNRAIRQIALTEHTTISELIRRAVADYLRTYHPELAAHSRAVPGLSESRPALPQP